VIDRLVTPANAPRGHGVPPHGGLGNGLALEW